MPPVEQVSFRDVGMFVAICILGIGPLLSVANFLLGLFGKPQRRNVTIEAEFATKEDVKAVDEKVETLKAEIIRNGETRRISIEAKVDAARKEARDDTEAVKREMSNVRASVAALDATTKQLNQTVSQIALRGGRDR